MTERLFRMLALGHGTVWNASDYGRSLGLSYHTVNSYVEYLQGAFLVRMLPPLHANLRKRLLRSPKLYWRGRLRLLLRASTERVAEAPAAVRGWCAEPPALLRWWPRAAA